MDAAELVRARQAAIRQCVRAGAEPHDAEDHAQDALIALLEQGTQVTSVGAWVATVARRRHADQLRRRIRERAAAARLAARRSTDDADPQQAVPDRAQAAWMVRTLDTLPPATQAVCRAAARGLAVPGIARALGLSVRSVESHLTRARRHVRRLGALVAVGLIGFGQRCVRGVTQYGPVEAGAAIAVPAAALLALAAPVVNRPAAPAVSVPRPPAVVESSTIAPPPTSPAPPSITASPGRAPAPQAGAAPAPGTPVGTSPTGPNVVPAEPPQFVVPLQPRLELPMRPAFESPVRPVARPSAPRLALIRSAPARF